MVEITLKGVRVRQGISVRELARRSGISKSQISDIENRRSIPTIETLWMLAKALEVKCEDLYVCK